MDSDPNTPSSSIEVVVLPQLARIVSSPNMEVFYRGLLTLK